MNISVKLQWRQCDAQFGRQEVRAAVQNVGRQPVGGGNQRTVTVDDLRLGVRAIRWANMRVVPPQRLAGSLNMNLKFARISPMQVANRAGEHDDISQRIGTFQKQPAHTFPAKSNFAGLFYS